ncbi:MAG: FAD-binding oxidoreductase [Puniceicoccaceae bacterium]
MTTGNSYDALSSQMSGRILQLGDASFEDARQIWNSRLTKSPAVIVQCRKTQDVSLAVRFANANGLQLAVRGGGHSYAGLGSADGCLLIDFSGMKEVDIDAAARTATVQPGVRWGEFYEGTLPHGLLPAGGTVSSVGVAGFTLGGGSGWLTRKHGLALDNLLSVEVVTADGDILTASETENPDLFWGIRGSAGNLAIVTRFTFQLHPVPAEIFAGQVIYPMELAEQAMQVYREVMQSAPEGFTCYPATFRIPPIEAFPAELHGQVVFDFILAHIGDIPEGEKTAARLREIGEPIMDLCAPQPLADHLKVFDAGTPPGQRWYSRSHYLKDLSDEAISVFLKHSANMQGAFTFAYFESLGGAVSRIDSDATAFPHREAPCDYHILAGWPDGEEDASIMQWVRDFHADMVQFSNGGVYVNLLGEDEGTRVREAYGSNYDRLVELKQRWDPENRLQNNHNIRPH